MYFHYYKYLRNFGDALNEIIWPQFIKAELTLNPDDTEEVFVGIGTLLNETLPVGRILHIFGSGAGYGNTNEDQMDNWNIHFVRGPLTAKNLGIDNKLAIADPAILVHRLFDLNTPKKHTCSFMPHHAIDSPRYRDLCENIGINYISPQSDCKQVISEISMSHRLICSAMHGAIVAEALRVPWLPVITDSSILKSKWNDWAESMQLSLNFENLPAIWPAVGPGIAGKALGAAKRIVVQNRLRLLARSSRFILGTEKNLSEKLRKIEEKIDSFNESQTTNRRNLL